MLGTRKRLRTMQQDNHPAPKRRPPPRRRTRDPSPPGPRTTSPSPQRNRPTVHAPYRITVFEGYNNVMALSQKVWQFHRLCQRPDFSVSEGYVAKMFGEKEGQRDGVFAMVGSLGPAVGAFARCTLHTTMDGVPGDRIVFIDLVCAAPDIKGLGAVLMAELQRYARNELKANSLVLQSVNQTPTLASYYAKGFTRGPAAPTAETREAAQRSFAVLQGLVASKAPLAAWQEALGACSHPDCRAATANQLAYALAKRPARITKKYLAALNGQFFPPYNQLYSGGNTLVMSKSLGPATTALGRVKWEGRYGQYTSPRQVVLSSFEQGSNGRLYPAKKM